MRHEDDSRSPAIAPAADTAETTVPASEAVSVTAEFDSGEPAVVEEVLIEEVSIDGMCGVY